MAGESREDPVYKAPGVLGGVDLGKFDRLVDHDCGRSASGVQEFRGGHVEYQAVDYRHALEWPTYRCIRYQCVRLASMCFHPFDQGSREVIGRHYEVAQDCLWVLPFYFRFVQ